jgi:hypothetical protein
MKSVEFGADSLWAHRFWKTARRIAAHKSQRAMSDLAAMAVASITDHGRNRSQSFGARPTLDVVHSRRKK